MNALDQCHRRSFAILAFVIAGLVGHAQLTAKFSGLPLNGCSPLVVNFTDQSAGGPTQWKWDLGNGVISSLQNPSTTYFIPGTYNVKLVVLNASGTDSIVKLSYVTVYAGPTVGFSADKQSGCFPLKVNFTDQSTPGDGIITAWYWDFGDGSTSTDENPFHIYTSAGNFTVTLKITNSFGCVKTYTRLQYINVAIGITAAFSNTAAGLCPLPTGINFTNTTSGPQPLSYTWNFGDGANSTVINPSHTYIAAGSYTVSLIVSSTLGCTDTITKTNLIVVGNIAAGFSGADTVCERQPVTFTNTTTPSALSYGWTFGNGNTSTATHPTITYSVPGTYSVKLVGDFGGCKDSITKQIVIVAKPVTAFSATPKTFCSLPATVSFTNFSAGTNTVLWNFGDGDTSTQQNPMHIYTAEGNFTVTLIVTNRNGCSDTLIKPGFITIKTPKVIFTGLPANGCEPLTVTPAAVVLSGHTISSYQWYFGDGATSALQTPTHIYTGTGTYSVKLVFTTADGCTDSTTYVDSVRVGSKPQGAFTYSPTNVCAYQNVSFQNTTIGPSTNWFWIFGDGTTSTLENPVHSYQDTGWQNVQFIVINNTCPDTVRIMNALHVKPPIASFLYTDDCSNRYEKKFIDMSLGATTWFWNFGDGTTSTQQNNTHMYAAPGTYVVTLYVSNDTCSNSTQHTIKVVDEKAQFHTPDPVICRKQITSFISTGIDTSKIAFWLWNFGDGSSDTTKLSASHSYTNAGTYNITLIITDILGCKDSMSLSITVNGPKADFSASNNITCLFNNNTIFTDLSLTDGVHPITKYIWSYGDGTIDSVNTTPVNHTYNAPQAYTVMLKVTDGFGCSDTITKPAIVTVVQPRADFSSPDVITCTGKSTSFVNASAGSNLQFNWSFGDGNTDVVMDPVHLYNSGGVYDVQLSVTDQYGCKDSILRPSYITVSYPKAILNSSDTVGSCPPFLVNFFNLSTNYVSKTWNFGDGSSSAVDSPSHFYTKPGVYIATLTATGAGGCTDVVTRNIIVKGPNGSFTYSPLIGCKPLQVSFKATTQSNISFTWDFADGTIVVSPDSIIQHTYINTGDYTPKIILTDADGCSFPIEGTNPIKAAGLATSFTLNRTNFCNDGAIQFTNTTLGNDPIISYQWDFGDGGTSTAQHPSHYYTTPGLYTVSMLAATQTGCRDSVTLIDTIKVFANPIVGITNGQSDCVPLTVNFKGAVTSGNPATISWLWDFDNGKTDSLQNPSAQVFLSPRTYNIKAIATDEHSCRDTTTSIVTAYGLPEVYAGPDVYVCQGSFVQLTATGADTFTWKNAASLSCTNCASPLAAPHDSTVYTVTGATIHGCTDVDSVMVRVHYPFTITVSDNDTICVGKTVSLTANGAENYVWIPATGVSNPSAGITTATPLTTTLYKVIAKDNAGCFTDTGYVNIKVWPYPRVEAGPDQTINIGNTVTLKPAYSADIVEYHWSNATQTLSCTDCPEPVAHVKESINKYTVQVKNGGGCVSTDDITVYVICNGGNLFIPNTFSPNGDGRNETFYLRGKGISHIKSLHIYDRWGEEVFAGANFAVNDAAAGWNGLYKGRQLPPDVYVYTCEVVCDNNEILFYKGDITLLR